MGKVVRRLGRDAVMVGLLFSALPAGVAASPILLYDQPATFPGPSSTRTSYGYPTEDFFRTYDDFALTEAALITSVTWQGSYNDFVTPTNNPASPNTVSFELGFWADAAGIPDTTALSLQTFPIASVTAVFVGLTPSNLNVFNYSVPLSTPFFAQQGTTYWLSIFSNSSSFTPLWGWRSGSGGDGFSFQLGLDGHVGLGLAPPDRAFSLIGEPVTSVPEPASLLLLLSGLAGIARKVRRPN